MARVTDYGPRTSIARAEGPYLGPWRSPDHADRSRAPRRLGLCDQGRRAHRGSSRSLADRPPSALAWAAIRHAGGGWKPGLAVNHASGCHVSPTGGDRAAAAGGRGMALGRACGDRSKGLGGRVTPMADPRYQFVMIGGVPVVTAPVEIDAASAEGFQQILLQAASCRG